MCSVFIRFLFNGSLHFAIESTWYYFIVFVYKWTVSLESKYNDYNERCKEVSQSADIQSITFAHSAICCDSSTSITLCILSSRHVHFCITSIFLFFHDVRYSSILPWHHMYLSNTSCFPLDSSLQHGGQNLCTVADFCVLKKWVHPKIGQYVQPAVRPAVRPSVNTITPEIMASQPSNFLHSIVTSISRSSSNMSRIRSEFSAFR